VSVYQQEGKEQGPEQAQAAQRGTHWPGQQQQGSRRQGQQQQQQQ